MITQIIQRICFLLSSMLFGIMAYLQLGSKGGALVYCSVAAFRDYFIGMEPAQQDKFRHMLQYDNCFVLFFGLFLLAYAFGLRAQRTLVLQQKQTAAVTLVVIGAPFWFYLLLFMTAGYMLSDWGENQLLSRAINDKDFECCLFRYVQVFKWVLATGSLLLALLVDMRMRKLDMGRRHFWKPLLYLVFGIVLVVLTCLLLKAILG
ncbi:hypothetical protein [Taibaiella chishuiensis]|uniref:Uncharacterized protein n=1 Tax=Taibaiella chishuiensis TaxID=1434707 RepID=A0A2P8CX71_9BACT|nr:hypothetical protein [Taibaiella chishuiensis]PSK89549.1 hypothetical protein B0I18_111105 [Taibaiella chishuiensis]